LPVSAAGICAESLDQQEFAGIQRKFQLPKQATVTAQQAEVAGRQQGGQGFMRSATSTGVDLGLCEIPCFPLF